MGFFRRLFSPIISGFLFGIGFLAGSVILVVVLTVAAISLIGESTSPRFDSERDPERTVAVVPLEGEIFFANEFRRELRDAAADKDVRAIVVHINSPGGDVGASEEIFRAIREASSKKPIICSLGGVAASGGLYAAMGCQKIVTNRGTFTGSIGVIVMLPDISSILDRFDIGMTVVKSGALKDVGSPFRPPTPEEREFLQGMVNKTFEQFLQVIATSRQMPIERIRPIADGRVLLGGEALDLGLADEEGGLERAAKLALEQSGSDKDPLLIFPEDKGFFEKLSSLEASPVVRGLKYLANPRPIFLYRAG